MNDTSPPNSPASDATRTFDRPPTSAGEAPLLQHDVRGLLTPALLAADLLRRHADLAVVKRAETVVSAIMRIVERVA